MTKIENEIQYRWALARVEELLPLVNDGSPETAPEKIELDLLSGLVADYSDEHFDVGEPSLSDVLRLKMYEMGLTQKAMAALLDINASRLSDYMNGKAEPTLKHARAMCEKLDINPALLLGIA